MVKSHMTERWCRVTRADLELESPSGQLIGPKGGWLRDSGRTILTEDLF